MEWGRLLITTLTERSPLTSRLSKPQPQVVRSQSSQPATAVSDKEQTPDPISLNLKRAHTDTYANKTSSGQDGIHPNKLPSSGHAYQPGHYVPHFDKAKGKPTLTDSHPYIDTIGGGNIGGPSVGTPQAHHIPG